jgi:hypothetical protein
LAGSRDLTVFERVRRLNAELDRLGIKRPQDDHLVQRIIGPPPKSLVDVKKGRAKKKSSMSVAANLHEHRWYAVMWCMVLALLLSGCASVSLSPEETARRAQEQQDLQAGLKTGVLPLGTHLGTVTP